jgi:putative membrane-bound dehydrogenase-like protein
MYRAILLLPLICYLPNTPGADAPPPKAEAIPKGYHQIKLNGHTFTLPDGFTIELAAGPPLADRPIVAALDEKGRLYVCDSSGSNDKVAVQMKTKPHRIVRLEDTDGDGKYDKSTVYVANVMFPEGAMWLNGSLYVAAVPNILKFTDTDDDGKADKEEIWFDGTKVSPTVGGCANDLHGPYLGPDGWIYWCKGGFEKQQYTINGKPLVTKAAHIFRARPDGSGIEPVMTGGMDNPVDVVFTPSGERIFSCTFLQHPANGKRDGLIHAVYGAVYGKDHAPIYEHPWTSPHLMEPMTHLGPAAPCGLHRYESDQFGKDYENNLFCCQFNMQRVSRHILVPKGSTYVTKDSDFVVSDQHDFHPTDVIEDADGSLLILDTGGWYKLCCPSSQFIKADLKGAIYRVKKIGSHKMADPRGEKIEWAKRDARQVALLMGDRRPAVARQAADRFARSLDADVSTAVSLMASRLRQSGRLTVLRALHQAGHAEEVRRYMRQDHDPVVKAAAIHLVGLSRDKLAVALPLLLAPGEDPHVRRAAGEALGRIGLIRGEGVVEKVFYALTNETNDRVLDHSLTYALIEIGDVKEVAKGLAYESPRVRRAALAALDQMPNGNLDPKFVLAELNSPDRDLRETAWWIAGRHSQWGEQLVEHFAGQIKKAEKLAPVQREELSGHLAKFAKNEAVQTVLGTSLPGATPERSQVILRAMARSGLKTLPENWEKGIATSLVSNDRDVQRSALATLQTVQSTKDFSKLLNDMKWPPEKGKGGWTFGFYLQVQATAPPGSFSLNKDRALEFATWLDRNEPPEIRAAASEAIARSTVTAEGLRALAPTLKSAHPLDIPKLIQVFAKSTDEKVGLAFVAALADPKVLPSVRVDVLKPILVKYPPAVRAEADKLYAKLAEARKDESAKLERILTSLPAGDIRRGQAVFFGAKAQCVACHKIGYVGGLIGPDLSAIGKIRNDRDLLESIVFPSASFVRSYEPVRVVTLDGRTLTGILKKDAPDEIILTIGADKEERIARADVESISPGTVSVMPDGFDKQVTPQELADLVAFLKACK